MEAIWAVTSLWATWGKLYTRLSTKKSAWRAYLMGLIWWVFMPKKTLGKIFAGIRLWGGIPDEAETDVASRGDAQRHRWCVLPGDNRRAHCRSTIAADWNMVFQENNWFKKSKQFYFSWLTGFCSLTQMTCEARDNKINPLREEICGISQRHQLQANLLARSS